MEEVKIGSSTLSGLLMLKMLHIDAMDKIANEPKCSLRYYGIYPTR